MLPPRHKSRLPRSTNAEVAGVEERSEVNLVRACKETESVLVGHRRVWLPSMANAFTKLCDKPNASCEVAYGSSRRERCAQRAAGELVHSSRRRDIDRPSERRSSPHMASAATASRDGLLRLPPDVPKLTICRPDSERPRRSTARAPP